MWQFIKRWFGPKSPFHRRYAGVPSDVEVFDRGAYRMLKFAESPTLIQGKRHRDVPLDFGLNYIHQHMLAVTVHPNPKRFLVLGLGVGALPTLIRHVYPEAFIQIVEINQTVIDVAQSQFHFELTSGDRLAQGDALKWLHDNSLEQFDVILNDCFDGLASSVEMRRTPILKTLSEHLSAGGVLITNLLKHQGLPDDSWLNDHTLHSFVWPAKNKSNLTLVFSKTALNWPDLSQRAKGIDKSAGLPFCLEEEMNRLKAQS